MGPAREDGFLDWLFFPLSVAVSLAVGWWVQRSIDRRDRLRGIDAAIAAHGSESTRSPSEPGPSEDSGEARSSNESRSSHLETT